MQNGVAFRDLHDAVHRKARGLKADGAAGHVAGKHFRLLAEVDDAQIVFRPGRQPHLYLHAGALGGLVFYGGVFPADEGDIEQPDAVFAVHVAGQRLGGLRHVAVVIRVLFRDGGGCQHDVRRDLRVLPVSGHDLVFLAVRADAHGAQLRGTVHGGGKDRRRRQNRLQRQRQRQK